MSAPSKTPIYKLLMILGRASTKAQSATQSQGEQRYFPAGKGTCVLTLKTMEEADAHMDTGKHVKEVLECESVYDTVRKRWADKVTDMNVVTSKGLHISIVPGPTTSTSQFSSSKGWALKTNKTPKGNSVGCFGF